jgi:uncharacterized membrane protein YciS (DUF1049 family)
MFQVQKPFEVSAPMQIAAFIAAFVIVWLIAAGRFVRCRLVRGTT